MANALSLDLLRIMDSFEKVGWFIPPYATIGSVREIAENIRVSGPDVVEIKLESFMSKCYDEISLAAMILHRYPNVPFVCDYKVTIAEAVEAHFFGLHHVSVSGLLPVVEGVGRALALSRGIKKDSLTDVINDLGNDFINEACQKRMGATDEVQAVVESFIYFTKNFLYVRSSRYPLPDMTNRHGIAHGIYRDVEYGTKMNFFKVIAAVNFLTFMASVATEGSWFAPDPTTSSINLAARYAQLAKLRSGYGSVTEQTDPIDWSEIMIKYGFFGAGRN